MAHQFWAQVAGLMAQWLLPFRGPVLLAWPVSVALTCASLACLAAGVEVEGRTALVMQKRGGRWLRAVQSNWIPTTPECYRRCERD